MKRIIFFTLLLFCCLQLMAQFGAEPGITAHLNTGLVLNNKVGNKFGYGLSVQAQIPTTTDNYFIAGIRGMTNPFDGKSFFVFKNGFNSSGDALNYMMIYTGYRVLLSRVVDSHIYAEPRAGVGFAHGFAWSGISLSPAFGIEAGNFDLQLFMDAGFGETGLNMKRKSFYVLGLGLGYRISSLRTKGDPTYMVGL